MTPLLAAAGRLERVLLAENAALQALDLHALPGLLHEKAAAAAALDAVATLPAAPAADLQAQAARVRGLATENRRLLEHAILVQDRVLRLVASAAREAGLREASRYGAAGRPRPDGAAVALRTRA